MFGSYIPSLHAHYYRQSLLGRSDKGLRAVFLFFVVVAVFSWHSEAQSVERRVHRILAIFESDSNLPAARQIIDGMKPVLDAKYSPDLEIYTEYLDIIRFPEHGNHLAEGISEKYSKTKLDIVLAVGPSALRFVLQHKAEFAPGVPVGFGAVNRASLDSKSLLPDVRGVTSYLDVTETVRLAQQLQPDAKRIVVITGSSKFDATWQSRARKALGDRFGGMTAEYISNLSIEKFIDYARGLDRDAILLILTVTVDADGRTFIPRDSASQIAATSGAPPYTVYSTYLGSDFVAGYTGAFHDVGKEMALLATAILGEGKPASQITEIANKAYVDWREMERRGLDTARIPENAIILNREPTLWERYRWQAIGALGIILFQAATITGLILQEGRRKRVEAERTHERLEFAHLARATQLGELSGAFAHELNQPLTSILANAQVGTQMLDTENPDLVELRAILVDIADDDKRAVQIIGQLKRLLVKGETSTEIVDLNHIISTTVQLARGELMSRRTNVEVKLYPSALQVRGNSAQLQQIILNLLLNAADAMMQSPSDSRKVAIQARTTENGWREVSVSDQGPGIPPELRADIFKPFISTKKSGLGLGLSICQSIAKAHGGRMRIDERPGPGAVIFLELPSP
jgi:signal transduction histidine kinase